MATDTTITDAVRWLPFLLQTADPLFPTGAYAHSLGAEEMARLGILRDEATLLDFLRMHTLPVLREQELPYLRFAMEAPWDLCALDAEIDTWKLAHETREASVQIGVRRLRALLNICPNSPHLVDFAQSVERGDARGHHLIVFAQQCTVEALPLAAALMTWAYQALAAICAAALKLTRIGQDAIHRPLRAACAELDGVIENSLAIERADAGCFSPLLEIASMRHERAFERLFIS